MSRVVVCSSYLHNITCVVCNVKVKSTMDSRCGICNLYIHHGKFVDPAVLRILKGDFIFFGSSLLSKRLETLFTYCLMRSIHPLKSTKCFDKINIVQRKQLIVANYRAEKRKRDKKELNQLYFNEFPDSPKCFYYVFFHKQSAFFGLPDEVIVIIINFCIKQKKLKIKNG